MRHALSPASTSGTVKATDGKRLKGLTPDEQTAPIVRQIFAEFLAGTGLFAIAEGLTANHVPCPSAHDRARNRHRSGIAWSKSAVRVILTNPRYCDGADGEPADNTSGSAPATRTSSGA